MINHDDNYENNNDDNSDTNQSLNPYIVNNPSVMSYIAPTQQSLSYNKSLIYNENNNFYQPQQQQDQDYHQQQNNDSDDGSLPFYRVDHTSSTLFSTDDIAIDGCSRCYLYATKSITRNNDILILRMKLPTTFFDNYSPDKIFHSYQARYFSVTSSITNTLTKNTFNNHMHHDEDDNKHDNKYDKYQKKESNDKNIKSSLLSSNKTSPLYYGVNTRLLKQYIDNQGYFYIFFASNNYSMNLAKEQGLGEDSLVPPVMSWGQYKGYVLGKRML